MANELQSPNFQPVKGSPIYVAPPKSVYDLPGVPAPVPQSKAKPTDVIFKPSYGGGGGGSAPQAQVPTTSIPTIVLPKPTPNTSGGTYVAPIPIPSQQIFGGGSSRGMGAGVGPTGMATTTPAQSDLTRGMSIPEIASKFYQQEQSKLKGTAAEGKVFVDIAKGVGTATGKVFGGATQLVYPQTGTSTTITIPQYGFYQGGTGSYNVGTKQYELPTQQKEVVTTKPEAIAQAQRFGYRLGYGGTMVGEVGAGLAVGGGWAGAAVASPFLGEAVKSSSNISEKMNINIKEQNEIISQQKELNKALDNKEISFDKYYNEWDKLDTQLTAKQGELSNLESSVSPLVSTIVDFIPKSPIEVAKYWGLSKVLGLSRTAEPAFIALGTGQVLKAGTKGEDAWTTSKERWTGGLTAGLGVAGLGVKGYKTATTLDPFRIPIRKPVVKELASGKTTQEPVLGRVRDESGVKSILGKFMAEAQQTTSTGGSEIVWIPRWKLQMSKLFPDYIPRPTFAGSTLIKAGGQLTLGKDLPAYDRIIGLGTEFKGPSRIEKTFDYTQAQAEAGRAKVIKQLTKRLGYTPTQAEAAVRFNEPKLIKSLILGPMTIQISPKGEVIQAEVLQLNRPQKAITSGFARSEDWGLTFGLKKVETGGKYEPFKIEQKWKKLPQEMIGDKIKYTDESKLAPSKYLSIKGVTPLSGRGKGRTKWYQSEVITDPLALKKVGVSEAGEQGYLDIRKGSKELSTIPGMKVDRKVPVGALGLKVEQPSIEVKGKTGPINIEMKTPEEIIKIGAETEDMNLFRAKELIEQKTKDISIGISDEGKVKPGTKLSLGKSTHVVEFVSPKEIIDIKEFGTSRTFDPLTNKFLENVMLTPEGVRAVAKATRYEVIPGQAHKANPLEFGESFFDSYKEVPLKKDTTKLFHGTTKSSAEKALAEGLKPAADIGISRGTGISHGKVAKLGEVFATPDLGWAKGWAGRAAFGRGAVGETPQVLEINLPRAELFRLFLRRGIEKGGGPEVALKNVPKRFIKLHTGIEDTGLLTRVPHLNEGLPFQFIGKPNIKTIDINGKSFIVSRDAAGKPYISGRGRIRPKAPARPVGRPKKSFVLEPMLQSVKPKPSTPTNLGITGGRVSGGITAKRDLGSIRTEKSLYYGTGQYERTGGEYINPQQLSNIVVPQVTPFSKVFTSVKFTAPTTMPSSLTFFAPPKTFTRTESALSVSPITRSVFEPNTNVKTNVELLSIPQPNVRTEPRVEVTPLPQTRTEPRVEVIPQPRIRTEPRLEPVVRVEPRLRVEPRITPTPRIEPMPQPTPRPGPRPPIKPPFIFGPPKRKQSKTKTKVSPKGYYVLTMKRKKPVVITPQPLSKGQALSFGTKYAHKTERATFKLIPTTKKAVSINIKPMTEQEVYAAGFRPPVKRGKIQPTQNVFIQRRPLRMVKLRPIEYKSIQAYKGRRKNIW
jgi:hypothetical protein